MQLDSLVINVRSLFNITPRRCKNTFTDSKNFADLKWRNVWQVTEIITDEN